MVEAVGDVDAEFGNLAKECGLVGGTDSGEEGKRRRGGGFSIWDLGFGIWGGRVGGRIAQADVGDDVGDGAAVDEAHGVVVDAALAADAVDIDDVRMVEGGGGLSFVL